MYRPLVVSLAAFVLVSIPQFLSAQNSCDKQFVVSEVSLSPTTYLPASEQAAIRARLIGRCFDNLQLGELASALSDVLQSFGYLQAAVPEPSITAFDTSRHPQPVSINVEVKVGERYKVREIQIHGHKAVSPEQIMALSKLNWKTFSTGTRCERRRKQCEDSMPRSAISMRRLSPRFESWADAGYV